MKEFFKKWFSKNNWKLSIAILLIGIISMYTCVVSFTYFERNEILLGVSDKYVTTNQSEIKSETDTILINNIFNKEAYISEIVKINDSTNIVLLNNNTFPITHQILKNEKESFELGDIGDFIGGYFGFLIGVIGALLTFLAFYIQYRANKDVQKQFRLQQFETQFHKMIDVYLNNKDKFSIVGYKNPKNNEVTISNSSLVEKCNFNNSSGDINFIDYITRDHIIFQKFLVELKVVYRVFLEAYKETKQLTEEQLTEDPKKAIFKESYKLFYYGLNKYNKIGNHEAYIILAIDSLKKIRDIHRKDGSKKFKNFYIGKGGESKTLWVKLNYEPFKGYLHFLPQYYRNLYSIVKYVVNENEDINLSDNQKINYLRILRSTMSEYEQTMLFYNWYSEFGSEWENIENHFFSEYKMIHNLKKITLIDDDLDIYKILQIEDNLQDDFFEAFN